MPEPTLISPPAINVYGQPLVPCSFAPLTGYFRDGCCRTTADDSGTHVVCAVMTDAFLEFSLEQGNDLISAVPEWNFPGLVAGDKWCLCALRWLQAWEAGAAPGVVLESTSFHALDLIPLDVLKAHAIGGDAS